MINLNLVRPVGCGLIGGLTMLSAMACSSSNSPTTTGTEGGAAGMIAMGGNAGDVSAMGGGGTGGAMGGGGAGGEVAASGGGAGGAAGGEAGAGGEGGASGECTPGPTPGGGMMYERTGWRAQWNVPCDFEMHGGCEDAMPPEKALDDDGDTRTSIGNTHFEAGSDTAQILGDTFTVDMQTCNLVSRIVMFASNPPNNQGKYDPRDFPGAVDVTVSSDCETSAQGEITGTFGEVVASGTEAQPGCQGGECNMPFTIDFDTPVPARCLKLELTEILELGGGIWWAITEFYVY